MGQRLSSVVFAVPHRLFEAADVSDRIKMGDDVVPALPIDEFEYERELRAYCIQGIDIYEIKGGAARVVHLAKELERMPRWPTSHVDLIDLSASDAPARAIEATDAPNVEPPDLLVLTCVLRECAALWTLADLMRMSSVCRDWSYAVYSTSVAWRRPSIFDEKDYAKRIDAINKESRVSLTAVDPDVDWRGALLNYNFAKHYFYIGYVARLMQKSMPTVSKILENTSWPWAPHGYDAFSRVVATELHPADAIVLCTRPTYSTTLRHLRMPHCVRRLVAEDLEPPW